MVARSSYGRTVCQRGPVDDTADRSPAHTRRGAGPEGTDARAVARGQVRGSGQATSPLAMAPLNRSEAVSPSRRLSRSRRRPTAIARAKSSSTGNSPSPSVGRCGRGMSCRRAMRRPPHRSDLRPVSNIVSPSRPPANRRPVGGPLRLRKFRRIATVPTPHLHSTRSTRSLGCGRVTIHARFA